MDTPPLDEIARQITKRAALELDHRLIWDMVCAYDDGVAWHEMGVGQWPDGGWSITRRVAGQAPEVIGPKHFIETLAGKDRLTLRVS